MTSWDYANNDSLRSAYLDSDEILERVDEYSLYCHYLGYEPIPHSGKYRSPIRTDDDYPSFGIFYTTKNPNREFLWKDQATGGVGDIFRLVQRMHSYRTQREAELKVIKDFKLGDAKVEDQPKIVYHQAPARADIDIRVTSRDFTDAEVKYWGDLNITPDLLSIYNVTAVKYYWLTVGQDVPYAPKEFAFAYRIWKQYKIYQPYAEKHLKFRNNFTDQHIEGLLQLKFQSPLLVITKSTKDVMHLASFGYEAVSPRSENTPILPQHLAALRRKYKHVVTLFDNDGKHRADFYPDCEHLEIPLSMGAKDPTDVCKLHGITTSKLVLDELLGGYL